MRFEAEARRIVRTVGLLDLHVDSLLATRLFGYDIRKRHRAGFRGQPIMWHCDLPRMREAGYRAATLGIHAWNFEYEGAWTECNRQFDIYDGLVAEGHLRRPAQPSDWLERGESDCAPLAAPGVEGAHMLNGKLDRIDALVKRGAAYMTLVHLRSGRAAANGFGIGANERDGLSGYGREVVAELERCGLIVDVAHVNNRGLLDVAAMATKPLLCTHTGIKSVSEHGRNISDEAVQAIAATGGVIGIIFAPMFLAGRLRADSSCIADHIERVVEHVGIEHVAFGSDYDGWVPSIPNDQRDCRDIWRIVAVLLERGWTEAQLDRLLSRNAREVLSGERARQFARASTSSP